MRNRFPARLLVGVHAVLILGLRFGFGQGTFQGIFLFSNDGLGGLDGGVRAPVYGPDVNNPSLQTWGNPTNATPSGTQTYSGPALSGTNYSVQGWYATNAASNPFQLLQGARAVPNSLKSFAGSGFFSAGYVTIPDSLPDPAFPGSTNYPYYVFLQVRVWDNNGGQFATWDDAWNASLAGSGRAVGWSTVFFQALTSEQNDTRPWPSMPYFQSFNVFAVPEPSAAALVCIGFGCASILSARRRRSEASNDVLLRQPSKNRST